MSDKKRKPRKNPLKEVGDHRDKMAMRAHQRVAFKRNDALALAVTECAPLRPADKNAPAPPTPEDSGPILGDEHREAKCGP